MIETRITKMLNIQYPLLQGAMAWIATGRLAGAVSEAGGLGIIGAGTADPQWLKNEIDQARRITQKPFGVNLVLVSPHIEEIIELILRENIPVVTTGAGNPGRYMPRFKERGIKVIPVVASVALARRLARQGADAVIAEGMESGGQVGELTTMCVVPMVAGAVDIPSSQPEVLRMDGIAAALALGAEGYRWEPGLSALKSVRPTLLTRRRLLKQGTGIPRSAESLPPIRLELYATALFGIIWSRSEPV